MANVNPNTFSRSLFTKITTVQDALNKTSLQIASNEKYQNYKGYAEEGNVERVVSLQSTINDIESYVRSNNRVISRLETMDQSINSLIDIAESFKSTIVKKRSPVGDTVPVVIEGTSALEQIQDILNVRSEGRYLFSGSKTDTPPVSGVAISSNVANGTSNSNYYNGDGVELSSRASDSQNLTYGVTAEDESFQELIAAIHTAIEGSNQDSDSLLQDAAAFMDSAISQLSSLLGKVNNSAQILSNINEVHEDSILIVKKNFEEITKTDIVEASTVMSELEAQIIASYTAWNKLVSLRLSDFMN